MTPAEQRVLDAALAYWDDGTTTAAANLLEAARALPRTLPPPVLTDNPAEVVQGEVRWDHDAPYTVVGFDHYGTASIQFSGWDIPGKPLFAADAIAADRLVSRPGVDL